jgi:hypothetical protein
VLIDWLRSRMRGQPIVLVVDEGWAVLKHPAGAAFAEEMARTGRGDYVAFYLATQQIEEVLRSGRAVFDNAAVRVLLKQRDNDLDAIVAAAGISQEMRQQLESAERGTAFVDWNGLVVKMRAQATPDAHVWMNTDPRNKTIDAADRAAESEGDDGDLQRERRAGILAAVGAAAPAAVQAHPSAGRRHGRTGAHRDGPGRPE